MSQQDREIVYEPHPVTPERKKELIGQGYRILDARFAPVGASVSRVTPDPDKQNEETAMEQAKAQLDALGIAYGPKLKLPGLTKLLEAHEESKRQVKEVQDELTEKGISFDDTASIDELLALLPKD